MKSKRDNTALICDVGELTGLFSDSTTLETFLQRIVKMIASHMHSDVCSIYLYDEQSKELIMQANIGLNPDCIGKIKLKVGEGLTGLAVQEQRPICERNASKNSNFRYFSELGEEKYESFLVVPMIRATTIVGAIVIQNKKTDYFDEEDINTLRAVTSQLANTIEMARLLISLESRRVVKKTKNELIKWCKGKTASEGSCYGQAVILDDDQGLSSYRQIKSQKKISLKEFRQAVQVTEKELEKFQRRIEENLSDVASLIFSAQILMLKDANFIGSIETRISNGESAVDAVVTTIELYLKKFENISDEYLREKSKDLLDIGKRLLDNLVGRDVNSLNYEDKIIISPELLPSDILKLSSQGVKGIIVLTGGTSSHVSIIARSLKIPLIIAEVPELLLIPINTVVFIDSDQGNVYVDPTSEMINSFHEKEKIRRQTSETRASVTETTKTSDGTKVILQANINLLGELPIARAYKADGIGLYRTEFPFIIRENFPSEEEQFVIYQKLIAGMSGKEVTIRTLDIGGDKVLPYLKEQVEEKNPFLGLRSIRFSLKNRTIFSQQIRAILRAGLGSKVRIMFPMISSVDEFLLAKNEVFRCLDELHQEGLAHVKTIKIGIMIELPSVIEIIDELARDVDFFSIGTNDFIQYMLAVDRTNEKVADLYLPYHPAVLRALKKVVSSALKYRKDISVCGDMAQDSRYLEYLLGIGIRKLSINSEYIPRIQRAISKIDLVEAKRKTEILLSLSRLVQIEEKLQLFSLENIKKRN
jgi:phosphotransferase system enzyme I (PtsP)